MTDKGLSAGYVPATRQVDIPGGSGFTVRGLSLVDISKVYRAHAGDLGLWFERIVADGSVDRDTASTMIDGLLAATPGLAAAVIAAGADVDDPDAAASLSGLPLGVQIEALMKIGELTFTPEMPPKKVMEIVIRMAGEVAMTTLASPAT